MLTTRQLQALCIMAREAYENLRGLGLEERGFDAWRHEVCRQVTGKESFKAVGNAEYGRLRGRFAAMAGRRSAERTEGKRVDNSIRQLRWLVQKEVDAAGLEVDYVRRISADKFRQEDLRKLDKRQLQQLLYTIRNRTKNQRYGPEV